MAFCKHNWSEADKEFVRANWHSLSYEAIARHIGVSTMQLRVQALKMGLPFQKMWSTEVVAYLKKHFRQYSNIELANMLNAEFPNAKRKYTAQTVCVYITKRLGEVRTKEEVLAVKKRNIDAGCLNVPHDNARPEHTVFVAKAGKQVIDGKTVHKPALKIKLKDRQVIYRKWLWEQTYGPIPKGYRVTCIDGDHLNVTLENLTLVRHSEYVHKSAKDLSDNYVLGMAFQEKPELRDKIRALAKEHPEEVKKAIDLLRNNMIIKRNFYEQQKKNKKLG